MTEFRDRLNPAERRALDVFQGRCGQFGDRERRQVPLDVEETSDSGDPAVQFVVKGHAAVFNRKSLDLGGFQERIDTGAFNDVLDRNPDVHLVWDHDLGRPLARTLSAKYLLELREDPRGLFYYAKVAPTSFAADLRVLMEGGVIDQASFAFTVLEDTWEVVNRDKNDEYVLRTIHKVGDLYDVTITAQGAYPQTDSQVVRAYALDYATTHGRLEDAATDELLERVADVINGDIGGRISLGASSEDVAPDDPVGAEDPPSHADESVDGDPSLSPEGGDEQPTTNPLIRALRLHSRQEVGLHRSLLEKAHEPDRRGSTGVE